MDVHPPQKPPTGGIDVETTLAHFAILTFAVDPSVLRSLVHGRFSLDCIRSADGTERALISVVPFLDLDFRLARCPWPKWRFGQTNYRAYVTDTHTGEHVAWFFGTALDTPFVCVPRHAWKLPWHRARMQFAVQYDREQGRHRRYRLSTKSQWAPAELELEDSGQPPRAFGGFDDFESGFRLLTHPTKGYFHRRDGNLGSYSIWHERMQPNVGRVLRAEFPLLDRLGLVSSGDLSHVHSVLMQKEIDFTIYLPPKLVSLD